MHVPRLMRAPLTILNATAPAPDTSNEARSLSAPPSICWMPLPPSIVSSPAMPRNVSLPSLPEP